MVWRGPKFESTNDSNLSTSNLHRRSRYEANPLSWILPTAGSQVAQITSGPDGNLWFTETASAPANKIGRITTSGTINEFTVETPVAKRYGITGGPDGNVWFVENNGSANKIGRITAYGSITEFTIPTIQSRSLGITSGPDGNLWFTESGWSW